ncbi:MAG: hypothetical protein V4555_14095, partial [Acidobacteriota bacterium]
MRSLSSTSRNRCCFAFVLIAVFFSFQMQHYLGRSELWKNLHFDVYYFAAQAVHHNPHAELYPANVAGNPQGQFAPADSAIAHNAVLAGRPNTRLYLYPPLLADLLSPFTSLSLSAAAALWSLF